MVLKISMVKDPEKLFVLFFTSFGRVLLDEMGVVFYQLDGARLDQG